MSDELHSLKTKNGDIEMELQGKEDELGKVRGRLFRIL